MAIAKITLLGMYQYMNQQNDPLFKNLSVPDGMDKDKLIDAILYRGAEFGVLYADPYFMQSMIKIWSDRYSFTLERWILALSKEFNPIENYDRYEEWSDNGSRSKTGNSSRSGTVNDNSSRSESQVGNTSRSDNEVSSSTTEGTETSTNVETSETSETSNSTNNTTQTTDETKTHTQSDENKVSAYNDTTSPYYQPKDSHDTDSKDINVIASSTGSNGTTTVNGNMQSVQQQQKTDAQSASNVKSSSGSGTDNRTMNETGNNNRVSNDVSSDKEQEGHTDVHVGHVHGNIGVTTSSAMVREFINTYRFNLYDEASNLFLSEFCIYVY